ncbi:helix-turn-helix transcriptional regulator [Streptomyces sp. NBC_00040]|uniref:helix-turn-helix transcriptional regulator n=1 Tax=Streptomyces sp. NBC_00040 TaxID=2903616 RepID=UPI00386C8147
MQAGGVGDEAIPHGSWTFLTSHARVLLALARDPEVRLREVAETCVLTERTVQAIVADLEQDGYLTRVRQGRRNQYRGTPGAQFRHPAEAGRDIEGLLALFADDPHASHHAPHRPDRHRHSGHSDPLDTPGPGRGPWIPRPAYTSCLVPGVAARCVARWQGDERSTHAGPGRSTAPPRPGAAADADVFLNPRACTRTARKYPPRPRSRCRSGDLPTQRGRSLNGRSG